MYAPVHDDLPVAVYNTPSEDRMMFGQPQVAVPPQPYVQPIIIVAGNNEPTNRYDNYNSKASKHLGLTQLTFAILALVVNSIGLDGNINNGSYDYYSEYGYGYLYMNGTFAYYAFPAIWCGLFFALSGSFALGAASKKTYCLIVTHMVLAIIGSMFGFVMIGFAASAVGEDSDRLRSGITYTMYPNWGFFHSYDDYGAGYFDYDGYWGVSDEEHEAVEATKHVKKMLVMDCIFLICSVVEFVACIWSSSLCCRTMCCQGDTEGTVQQAPPQHQQQLMQRQPYAYQKQFQPSARVAPSTLPQTVGHPQNYQMATMGNIPGQLQGASGLGQVPPSPVQVNHWHLK